MTHFSLLQYNNISSTLNSQQILTISGGHTLQEITLQQGALQGGPKTAHIVIIGIRKVCALSTRHDSIQL